MHTPMLPVRWRKRRGGNRLEVKFMLAMGSVIIFVVALLFYTFYEQSKQAIINQIDREARTLIQQIVFTRAWIADHGGVFARKQPGEVQNPLLPKHDVRDGKGEHYLLHNPALATRELASYAAATDLYHVHLTSLKLRNPLNAPTPLEREALQLFDSPSYAAGTDGVSRIIEENGRPFYCRIIPLRTEKSCLPCHQNQGYRVGDTRGALSVILPMDEAHEAIIASKIGFLLTGFAIIVIVFVLLYVLVNHMVLQPLTHLQQVAGYLSAGHLHARATVATGDEFEHLAEAFNTMTGQIVDGYYQSVKTLAIAVEMRDPYTRGHVNRVSVYAVEVARELGLSPKEQEEVEMGAILHDIGKIGIADAILKKAGPLTPGERGIMESHAIKGAEILAPVTRLAFALPAIRHHHERFDGGGYPDGLKGNDIPLVARILAVVDTFDAMTTDRPYRKGLSAEVALREISEEAGRQFDPDVVAAFHAAYNTGFSGDSERETSIFPAGAAVDLCCTRLECA